MNIPKPVRRYRYVDAALVRATAHSGDVVPRQWPEVHDDAAVEQWCTWIAEVWAQAPVADAVAVASPVLATRVRAVCDGQRPSAGQLRRVVLSLARYLVRMRGRATPFGLFAGVGVLRFGPQPAAGLDGRHRPRVRADAVWLAEVIARLEASVALRRHLQVIVNDLAFVRGERLVVPWQPHAADPHEGTPVEVSVRHSPAVQAVMREARLPILAGDLIDKLAVEFPGAPATAIAAMVNELMARGVLITSLRPPSTSPDGLAHLLRTLDRADADRLAEQSALVRELREVRMQLKVANRAVSWAGGEVTAAAERMRALAPAVEQPLMVDLRLGATMVLPEPVAQEAESAADALWRLAPDRAGEPAWRHYHARFLERYGVGAVVPVDQLVDVICGLGFPQHIPDAGGPAPARELSRRDERLLALAQQAALDGVHEVVLDDGGIDALAAETEAEPRPVPHMSLCAEIRAASMSALARGAFTLTVTGVGRSAIALTGRFLDLTPDDDRRRIVDGLAQLPCGVSDAMAAQLSFPPSHPAVENVARTPLVLPNLLSLAEHHDDTRRPLRVRDLAVTADHIGLYLVSLSRRRVVEPVLANATARHTMPALARFLFELPRARCTPVSMLSWGVAACLPFLPRVRYGRSILSPARWRIPNGHLPGPAAPWRQWVAAIAWLRDRLGLPNTVSVGRADLRLRLKLDDPMDLTLLRAHLDKQPDAPIVEAPRAAEYGWAGGRAHEIVVPLATTTPPARPPAIVTGPGPLPLVGRGSGVLPGGRVLFAKLYGHPDGFDTILTSHLPVLLSEWDEPPMWWFLRYVDPAPHLRLRLHLRDYGQGAVRVGAWAADLRDRGLVSELNLDTYQPETARYGAGAAMAAAEALFAADSVAVLAQQTALAADRTVHLHALTAASLVDLTAAVTGSRAAGMRWLLNHPDLAGQAHVRNRDALRQALSLAGCGREGPQVSRIGGGPGVVAAWRARHKAAARYVDTLAAGSTHVRPASVVASLLHLHRVRALGINPADEARCHHLARAAALAWRARRRTTKDGAP